MHQVGLNTYPKLISIEQVADRNTIRNLGLDVYETSPSYKNELKIIDKNLQGISSLIDNINIDKSIILWDYLLEHTKRAGNDSLNTYFSGIYIYVPKGRSLTVTVNFDSKIIRLLKETSWLYDKTDTLKPIDEITIDTLNEGYNVHDSHAKELIKFLGIKNIDHNLNLNDIDKKALDLGRTLLEEGITPEEIAEIIATHKRTQLQTKNVVQTIPVKIEQSNDNFDNHEIGREWEIETTLPKQNEEIKDTFETPENDETEQVTKIPTRARTTGEIPKPFIHNKPTVEDEVETDELVPVQIDPKVFRKNFDEIEKKKDTAYEEEKELIRRRNEYLDIVQNSEMYSFGWFKALLELEDSFTAEDRVKRNPIRVVFNRATIADDGTLLLTETPNIPPTIQDIGEIQISFYSGIDNEDIKKIFAEVVSPQKDKIKVKLKHPDALVGYDLSMITRAVVEVSHADFILEKLKNAFRCLEFQDNDNLHNLLPQSLNFVFGPPGTGKTTYLSWLIGGLNPKPLMLAGQHIAPLMNVKNKILVLTPTNTAADVLVEKIMDNYDNAKRFDYEDWLMRFGETKSDKIMKSSLFIKDRKVPQSIYSKGTLVTTIARFPYDTFKIERKSQSDDSSEIKNFAWDYIIFDEASMINLAAIVYVIYQASKINPEVQFIIGGDPYQIHPITQFKWEGWSFIWEPKMNSDGSLKLGKDGNQEVYEQDAGNIYSMVGLINDKSFIHPQTTPHQFPVHNLTTQYRSIEPIGALFSNYRYHGKLQHDRTKDVMLLDTKKAVKHIEVKNLPLKPITLIHFHVKKFPPVYRPRSVKGSPYHVYSAIFAVELLKYIQQNSEAHSAYKIGVICPFKIQESIINKLITNSCKGNIEIVTGTVHGFQGDQCDMVIVVFNPSTKITRSTRSFLNKKNILNVAISRAKDCLVILVPESKDGDINVEDLHQIEWIKRLARTLPETANQMIEYKAEELEKTIFNDSKIRIEDFAVVSNHQNVNLYTDSKIKYEIRIDEHAIDIKI